jgi:hypothetical protein
MADAVKEGDPRRRRQSDRHRGHRQEAEAALHRRPPASRVTTARRLVTAGAFDKQIRKNNRLPT